MRVSDYVGVRVYGFRCVNMFRFYVCLKRNGIKDFREYNIIYEAKRLYGPCKRLSSVKHCTVENGIVICTFSPSSPNKFALLVVKLLQ